MTVELVVLTPVVVLFVLLSLALGRYELARQQVVAAAQAAAQAVSVADGPAAADSTASSVAQPVVAGDARACAHLTVSADTTDFVPGGFVDVVVTCRIDYSDLWIPVLPGSVTVRAAERAPIDPYRSVQ